MRKEYGYPTLEAICKASAGNETAIKEILKFYDAYITDASSYRLSFSFYQTV